VRTPSGEWQLIEIPRAWQVDPTFNIEEWLISSFFDLGNAVNRHLFPQQDLLGYDRGMLSQNLTFFLTKRSTPGKGEIIMVPHPTEPTVLEWLDALQARSKQFAFGVGLCERKVIEGRTEPIGRRANPGANPGGFSPFSVLDEPWQQSSPSQEIANDDDVPASPSVVEILSAPSVATVPITARRRQTSSNPMIWHNASCTVSMLEITKSSEIASLGLFPWNLAAADGPPLVMGERVSTLLGCEFDYSLYSLPGLQDGRLLIYEVEDEKDVQVRVMFQQIGQMLWKSFVEHLDIAQQAAHAWFSTCEVLEIDILWAMAEKVFLINALLM
jgi:hypothetical protein